MGSGRMDYGAAAPTYGRHRWALNWKRDPLLAVVRRHAAGSVVADVGCGTGDYLFALHEAVPAIDYRGFDLSPEMLDIARARCPWATLEVANADVAFPGLERSMSVVYSVDVLQHLDNPDVFFSESSRVLRKGGNLVVITDSEADIRARSLAMLFPTTIPINLDRYPDVDRLMCLAQAAGLTSVSRQTVHGHIALDDRFLEALECKAMSELRLISSAEHAVGMDRARDLARQGGAWLSQTTVVEWAAC